MGDGQKTGVGKRGARGESIAPSLLAESSPNLTV
jgi:hypothetical protein